MSQPKPQLLLLNPPGARIYLRDYYCSKTSKAGYLNQPGDFLILSGMLHRDFELGFLDAIADRLRPGAATQRILAQPPQAIIGLIGAVSLHEDLAFYRNLRQRWSGKLILTGDVVMDGEEPFLKAHPFVDALLLDFTDPEIGRYLQGEEERFRSISYRCGEEIRLATRQRNPTFEIDRPRHEIVAHPIYRHPFARRRKFATVLTDYGCPYPCDFCIMGELTYKTRSVESVMEELEWLVARGTQEIYFHDQTFGLKPDRTVRLCREMERLRPQPGWIAFTRSDLIDAERLALYKRAGCHTLQMGVETADPELLERSGKKLELEEIRTAFELCRRAGIRTVATFLFGMEGETDASREATVDFARRLGCDWASFNVVVPRMRTGVRKKLEAKGDLKLDAMDQSGHAPGWQSGTPVDYARWVRRANLSFYARPSYLFRRAISVRTWSELDAQLRFALGMLRPNRPMYEIASMEAEGAS